MCWCNNVFSQLSHKEDDCTVIECDSDLYNESAIGNGYVAAHANYIANNKFDVFSNGGIDFVRSEEPAYQLFLLQVRYNHHGFDENGASDLLTTNRNSEANMAFPQKQYALGGGYDITQMNNVGEGQELRFRINVARSRMGLPLITNGYNPDARIITQDRRMRSIFLSGGSDNGIWSDWGEAGSAGRAGKAQRKHIDAKIQIDGISQKDIIKQMVLRQMYEYLAYSLRYWKNKKDTFTTVDSIEPVLVGFAQNAVYQTRLDYRKHGIRLHNDEKVCDFIDEFDASRRLISMLYIDLLDTYLQVFRYLLPRYALPENNPQIKHLFDEVDQIYNSDRARSQNIKRAFCYILETSQSVYVYGSPLFKYFLILSNYNNILKLFNTSKIELTMRIINENEGMDLDKILSVDTQGFQRRFGFNNEDLNQVIRVQD